MEEYVLSISPEDFSKRIEEMYRNENETGDDTLNTIILNVAIKDGKINKDVLIQILKKAKNNGARETILQKVQDEMCDEKSVNEILIEHLKNKTDIHSQLLDLSLKVPCEERNKEDKEEAGLIAWLDERIN